MNFNIQLLSCIPEADHGAAKLVLFSIDQDLNLIEFTQPNDVKFAKAYIQKVNEIVALFLNNGVIIEDYSTENTRYCITQPLYTLNPVSAPIEFNVDEVRRLWSKNSIGEPGKMGARLSIESSLHNIMLSHGYKWEEIVTAATLYIENCKETTRFVRDLGNFIMDKEERSMLAEWVEEVRENQTAPFSSRSNRESL